MAASAAQRERRDVQVSVRVPADLALAFEKVAEREDRTVSAELRRIIRQHVQSNGEPLAQGGAA